MYVPRTAPIASFVVLLAVAGCGGDDVASAPAQPEVMTGPAVVDRRAARQLEGLYGTALDRHVLRRATRVVRPPVELPGGWWTLRIDLRAGVLTLSHPGAGDAVLRITRVSASRIDLAPDVGCEQRGAARLEPARLAWYRTRALLRFAALRVPCLTIKALLTSGVWRRT